MKVRTPQFINKLSVFTAFIVLISAFTALGQSAGDYRSNVFLPGDWSSASSWQRHNGTTWVAAVTAPTSIDGVITIQNGDHINLASAVTIDQVVIQAGGELYITNLISSVTATLNNGAGNDIDNSGTLAISVNGTLTGGGNVVNNVGASCNVNTGGILSAVSTNNGTMEISLNGVFANTTVINNGTLSLLNSNLSLNTATLVNNGLVTLDYILDSHISSTGGGVFTNQSTGIIYKTSLLGVSYIDHPTPGNITFTNLGIIKGLGQFVFRSTASNSGTISPGNNNAAFLVVNPVVVSSKNPVFNIDVVSSGALAGITYDQVGFTNVDAATVNISGSTLNVTDNAADGVGTTYTLFTSSSTITGTFSAVNLPPTLGNLTYNANSITVQKTGFMYTWTGGSSTWMTMGNWSPTRVFPASTDVLMFNSGGAVNVTNVPTQSLNALFVANNTTVNLQAASSSKTLTVGSSLNSYLSVASGSTLNALDNSGVVVNVSIGTGSKAEIGGVVNMQNGTFNVGDNLLQLHTSAMPLQKTSGQFTIGTNGSMEIGDPLHVTGPAISLPNNIFASAPTLTRLTVNRTNGVVFGNQSITVTQGTTLTSGNIVTNATGQLLFSSTAASPVETVASKIIGYAGILPRSIGTNALSFLGMNIAAGSNIGTVTITRKTGTDGINTFNGHNSIAATWVTNATVEPSPARSINFSWVSDFDNAANTSLSFQDYRFDGPAWTAVGSTALLQSSANPRVTTVATTIKLSGSWTIADQLNVLPITLTDFSAQQTESTVLLKWETVSEENSDHFEVQRLQSKEEGFVTLGSIRANGNSKQILKYEFTDAFPLQDKNYYRLKLIDLDGSFTYSDIILVRYTSTKDFSFYPNPNDGKMLYLTFPDQNEGTLQVVDFNQKELLNMPTRETSLSLDISDLKLHSGIYIIRYSVGNTQLTKKLIVR